MRDKMDGFQIRIPEVSLSEVSDMPHWYMWSDTQFEILKKHIMDFEAALDDEHEVGLLLTNFGQSVLMHVTDITYEKSVLMVFNGYVNGKQATLIQHISQLNFLLTTVENSPERPKRRIGFLSPEEE